MNENELSEDKTRNDIISKIDSKRRSVTKLTGKPESLLSQKEVYEKAIEDHKRKIEVLEERIKQYADSAVDTRSTLESREGELEHMENILARYDVATREREEVVTRIRAIIDADPWKPGDAISSASAYRKTPEYQELTARRDLLDNVIENALPDIRKILVSRGEVSVYNAKELGTELPV